MNTYDLYLVFKSGRSIAVNLSKQHVLTPNSLNPVALVYETPDGFSHNIVFDSLEHFNFNVEKYNSLQTK